MNLGLGRYIIWCLTLVLLMLTDLVLLAAGFRGLYGLVSRWPCNKSPEQDKSENLAACLLSMNSAILFYIKPVKCLQAAAVTTCLLRSHGIPAEMVVGVRCWPFTAHAWVELGETIIAGVADKSGYVVLDRI